VRQHRDVRIRVPVLARVEGEGALEIRIRDGAIEELQLRIFEPPRLFEKFLEGHGCDDVVDMVARICGICPVAYQVTAVQAFEGLFGTDPGPWVQTMRRVMYCGEWLQSHALHIHLLALPDFLGFDDAVEMARHHPEVVRRGLRLQALGNDIIAALGARSVHPVGLRVGGFHRAPAAEEVDGLRRRLETALPEAEALVAFCAGLDLPDDREREVFTSVALTHPDEYAICEGNIVSGDGHHIHPSDFDDHFREFQVPHSTALHAKLDGRPYLVGPLARVNLNLSQLPAAVRSTLSAQPVRFPSHNVFHSIVARAVEIHGAVLRAAELLEGYREPEAPAVPVHPVEGVAVGASEAPRGLLWHRYEVDARGRVTRARIVPPTSQNQSRIEEDIRLSLQRFGLDRDDEALRRRAETVIRNYDPCISCAAHFLSVRVHRH
jgi:coenzyme F420-reducing hydrogenase alpha subunit